MVSHFSREDLSEVFENEESRKRELNWFNGQVIFLTGGTGGLGGCLVYKLALQLPVHKIFVLCRVSKNRAIARWKENMPTHVSSILASRKVVFIVGDMTHPNYGIETTIIINCAANTSLTLGLYEAVIENCLPTLELTKLALKCLRLSKFVHVSNAYANSFLPNGVVLEHCYDHPGSDQCPEKELSQILSDGSTSQTAAFAWPCAQAKHLAERLINIRHPDLPVMILRPSFLGPAIQHPYPLYDVNGTSPLSVLGEIYLLDDGGNRVWHTSPGQLQRADISARVSFSGNPGQKWHAE
ncbi:hypothetical protein N7508_010464 [Penicillium antarcticum]|uniref:uncharacterized protein n=1 Tax=Penicillium antarcticum TaxID=416450 RepID=UPI002384A808|nr:uncharacterized protein N7508_010464 [Penicillium antarcticum]KAJ5295643.1 hypothetical protein N7508_010464 [Penicillium antarcticum]